MPLNGLHSSRCLVHVRLRLRCSIVSHPLSDNVSSILTIDLLYIFRVVFLSLARALSFSSPVRSFVQDCFSRQNSKNYFQKRRFLRKYSPVDRLTRTAAAQYSLTSREVTVIDGTCGEQTDPYRCNICRHEISARLAENGTSASVYGNCK